MTKTAKSKITGTKVAVLGAGAWGTALAMHISQQHQVSLWARNSGHVSGMRKSRANPLYLGDFKFHDNLQVEDDLAVAIQDADLILSVVPTAGFRNMLKQIQALKSTQPIIWAHKGLEPDTAKLPHEVALEEFGEVKRINEAAQCSNLSYWIIASGQECNGSIKAYLPHNSHWRSPDPFLKKATQMCFGDAGGEGDLP